MTVRYNQLRIINVLQLNAVGIPVIYACDI